MTTKKNNISKIKSQPKRKPGRPKKDTKKTVNKKDKIKKKMGRPKIEIDWDIFEDLCNIHCTLTEMAAFFKCSERTIERAVKRQYNETFVDTYKKKCGIGKMSLRRKQFVLADTSAAMAIWLGKQYLNQRDKVDIETDEIEITFGGKNLAEIAGDDSSR